VRALAAQAAALPVPTRDVSSMSQDDLRAKAQAALDAYLAAPTMAEKNRILRRRSDVLLSGVADALLVEIIQDRLQRGNETEADDIDMLLSVLRLLRPLHHFLRPARAFLLHVRRRIYH
jgi:hypothetical protein